MGALLRRVLRRILRVPGRRPGGGTPPAWAPSSLSGLVLDLRPDTGLFEESTLVTPTSIGGPVGGWENQGGVIDALQTTLGRRPTRRSGYLEFDGTDDGLLITGLGLGSGAQSIAFRFTRRNNLATSQRIFSTRAGGFWTEITTVNFGGYAEVCFLCGMAAGGSSACVGFSPGLGTSEHTLEIYYDGSGSGLTGAYAVYLDGSLVSLASSGVLSDAATLGAIGSRTDAVAPAAIDLKKVVAWTGDHRADRADIAAWLAA